MIHGDASWSGRERNLFYLNMGDGRFVDLSGLSGLDFPDDGRAFASLDLDFDGDLDLVVVNRTAPRLRLLRNDAVSGNSSIAFRLVGRPKRGPGRYRSSRDAVGAVIELDTPAGRRVKQVEAGSGYLSQSSSRIYFGLGQRSSPVHATVHWPSGHRQELGELPADHLITVVEGDSHWKATAFRLRNFDFEPVPPPELPQPGVNPEGYPLLEPLRLPPFEVEDLAGNRARGKSLRGRPLLVNFWATWCRPCHEEMRRWAEHYDRLRDAGAELVAVSVDEPGDRAQVERYAAERQLPFLVLLPDVTRRRLFDTFYRTLFVRNAGLQIPTTLLADAEGQVVKLYRGVTSPEILLADLARLRADPASLAAEALPYPGRRFVYRFARNFTYVATQFFDQGLYAAAIPYFKSAVKRQPTDFRARVLLGRSLIEEDQLPAAQEALQEALILRPGHPEAAYYLARVQLARQERAAAEATLTLALALNPGRPRLLRLYAEVLSGAGRWGQARSVIRSYLALRPKDAGAYKLLAEACLQLGALQEAERALLELLRLNPDDAQAREKLRALGGAFGSSPQ